MAKKFTFQGIDIPVAFYRGEYFFQRKEVSQAVGYATSITLPEGCDVIEVGANTYVSLKDLEKALESATGERLGRGAEFLHRVHEVYEIPERSCSELPIDEVTRNWLKAKADIETTLQLWGEAHQRESQYWDLMAAGRKSFMGHDDE